MAFRRVIRSVLDSPVYVLVMAILILFSVFAWDVTYGWLNPEVDSIVEGIMTTVFVLFAIEIVLLIIATDRWWRDFSIWLFIVATAMMAFEIPWLRAACFGTTAGVGALANLRLIKIFRVLARLGRLLRIIKSLVLSNVQSFIARVIRRNEDAEDRADHLTTRRRVVDESRKQSYDALERATTFAVVAIFSVLYIIATLFFASIQRDNSPDRGFEQIVSNQVVDAGDVQWFLDTFPAVYVFSISGETYLDRSDEFLSYRDTEVIRVDNAQGFMWLDLRDFARDEARRNAALTLVFIVSISYLVIIFNWIIARFALRLSGALNTLAQALEERDAYTRMHSKNVSIYAMQVAQELKLSNQERKVLRIAAELHDIGKIGVPQAVLGKPGPLDDDEYDIIKRHTEQGANILQYLVDFEAVILAACHHHEKFDGTGYPEGLSGKKIPRMARILAVCDVWDALTTDRPYRKAMEKSEAIAFLIRGKGTDFDPEMVDALLAAVPKPNEA